MLGLPRARREAVLSAHAAWLEAGLAPELAQQQARQYARRLRGRQLSRAREAASGLSRAASRHEGRFLSAFKQAIGNAQDKVRLTKLELALQQQGAVPWELLEPLVRQIGADLA